MTTCTAAKISSTPATISLEDFLVLAIDCIYNSLAQKYDTYKALIGSNRGNSLFEVPEKLGRCGQ